MMTTSNTTEILFTNFITGEIACVFVECLFYPFTYIARFAPDRNLVKSNWFQELISKIGYLFHLAKDKPRSIFAGVSHRLRQASLFYGPNFALYEYMKWKIPTTDPEKNEEKWMARNFLCGGLAGLICLPLNYPPLYMNKTNPFFLNAGKLSFLEKVRYRHEGFMLTSLSTFVNRAILFGFYDTFKFWNSHSNKKDTWYSKIINAYFASQAANIISHPFQNLVRLFCTREESTFWAHIKLNFEEKGLKPFLKADLTHRRELSRTLVLIVYDQTKSLFDKQKSF